MRPLDNLTVCVTSFGRDFFLARVIESLKKAGIRHVAVGAVCPTDKGRALLEAERDSDHWLSFDVNFVAEDIGCNNTWALAAYLSRTDRIVVLHDDDVLTPAFGEAYERRISPFLDEAPGCVTWRAHVLNEDGSIRPTDYWTGPTRVLSSTLLALRVMKFGELSLSPVVAVFDRKTVISASKEAAATLTKDACLERPGMLLGTEILAHFRHLEKWPRWLYLDEILSLYGSHAGSGTVRAEREQGGIQRLAKGYDLARQQCAAKRPFLPKPALILVSSRRGAMSEETAARVDLATRSRRFLFEQFDAIEMTVPMGRLRRSFAEFPFVRDLFDLGVEAAMPEDAVVYTNDDIGLTVDAPARIYAGLARGGGVAMCPRRVYTNPRPLVRSIKNCPTDGGIDVVAFRPEWWIANREAMPDMVIGRDAWDTVLATVAEEWADDLKVKSTLPGYPDEWWKSKAYCDDVCWHQPHFSPWQRLRGSDSPGAYNRDLAREFFRARGNEAGVRAVTV